MQKLTSGPRARSPYERLDDVATRQAGAFSRAQAEACGFTRSQIETKVASKQWERLLPGVFKASGAPVTWETEIHSVLLWAGRGAVLSHGCAAAVWGIPGFERKPPEVTMVGDKRNAKVQVHRASLDPREIVKRGALRMTSPARTLLDIAGEVNEPRLEAVLDHLLLTRQTSIRELRAQLALVAGARQKGCPLLRKLIDDRDPKARPSMSEMERIFRRLLKSSGLPAPAAQHPVKIGKEPAYIDFAYPQERLAIETDGYRWHGAKKRWEKDVMRTNELQAMGWRVVRITWAEMTERPERVVSLIRQLLAP